MTAPRTDPTLLLLMIGRLADASAIDGRTGVLTGDAWRSRAARALLAAGDRTLLMVDVDRFKSVNDEHAARMIAASRTPLFGPRH